MKFLEKAQLTNKLDWKDFLDDLDRLVMEQNRLMREADANLKQIISLSVLASLYAKTDDFAEKIETGDLAQLFSEAGIEKLRELESKEAVVPVYE